MQGALEGIDGVADIDLDQSGRCGKFTAPADLDVKATLDAFVESGNDHIKGWSIAE